jgi:PAS domain S-box-containing protein
MIERPRLQLPAWIRRVPLIAGACVCAIGIAVLIGWFQDVEILRSISPRFVSMKANAAVALVCLGASLLLAAARPRGGGFARSLLEAVAFAIGIATLVEYAAGIDLGIDQLLVTARPNEFQTASAGRMSALTATCFVLATCALFAERVATARGRTVARVLATCVGIIGLIALLGYLYGAPLLYRPFAASSAISVHAAIASLLLAAGIVALHPQYGLPSIATGHTLVGTHVRWLFPAAVLIPLLIGALAVQAYQMFGVARVAIAIAAAGTTIAIGLVIAFAAMSLRRMEDRLELSDRALATTKQGVLIADGDEPGRPIVYVNDAFTQLTGYSHREALGKRFDFLVSSTPDDPAAQQLASALSLGSNVTVTVPSKRRDGTVFSGRLSISVVPSNDEAVNIVGVLEDVTADQLAAMARLQLLAEASQARKDAESANQVKDVFFATITHELRSPLNACTMWLDVLALGPLSDKSTKAVDAIKRNLKIQTRLVNDLIDAAKISSGGIEIHREPHELAKLIASNAETWQLTAAARNVRFAYHPAERRHVLEVDPERLTQVLNNLIENAFANTPPNGRVELTVKSTEDGVAIEVEDTGTGLSAEDLQRVFTPFWRAQSTKHSHKGLGLGLAIAENLVKGHGGTLGARSEGPGKGCVFTVRLPNREAAATNETPRAQTDPRIGGIG